MLTIRHILNEQEAVHDLRLQGPMGSSGRTVEYMAASKEIHVNVILFSAKLTRILQCSL